MGVPGSATPKVFTMQRVTTCSVTWFYWKLCALVVLAAGSMLWPTPGPVEAEVAEVTVVAVAAGHEFTCALPEEGGVKCWGHNNWGQLGDGLACGSFCTTPTEVSGLTGLISSIAAGGEHACVVTGAGAAKCWGSNYYAQLGDGTTSTSTTPVDVVGLQAGTISVGAGVQHSCALMQTQDVKCWGRNLMGALGNGTTVMSTSAVDVSGLTGVASITLGGGHSCALTTAGGVYCWGNNHAGQLGAVTMEICDSGIVLWACSTIPVKVSGLDEVVAIEAGSAHTCAVIDGGGVKCWGQNGYGQLGDGTTIDRPNPIDVSGLPGPVTAVALGGLHTCVLTTASGVYCWGQRIKGQLGDGTSGFDHPQFSSTPVNVNGLAGKGITAITAVSTHTCALTAEDRVKCWGSDQYGQLGTGRTETGTSSNFLRSTPIYVIGLGPKSVGGIAELPAVAATPLETTGSSGPSTTVLSSLAVAVAAALVLSGAAWYARRRWAR